MDTIKLNNDQPLWMGLESYKESDSNIFFGRDNEIQQLSSDIFHNIQTVIYGPSGTGKTSIIRAGIFKIARENGYFPIYIRLSHPDSIQTWDYHNQIIDAIKSEAQSHEIDIDQIIAYIKNNDSSGECRSLWEYLHCNEFWSKGNYPLIPLIVIDQFEEIFTLCQDKSKQAALIAQISDLCDNRLPLYIKEHINDRRNIRIEYPESANYRIVISLREDFLARLEELSENIPALKRNRYSLQPINDEQALDIIQKPSPGLVSEDVAIKIIECVTRKRHGKDFRLHNGADILVEPAILSLFCAELDKRRREQNLDIISNELIGEFGEDIIKDFYLESLKDLSKDKVEFLENGLLTDDGFRDNIALQNAKNHGFTDQEISNLTNRRILRIEAWDGTQRIEFTHDVLCKVAAVHRDECAKESETIKILQEEENKRQRLIEEQERERIKRNIEYNKRKRATERNVLVHKGRRLLDNALDFGQFRTIQGKGVDGLLNGARLIYRAIEPYFEEESDSNFTNQQVFSDPLLNNSICALNFYKEDNHAPTIDGIYSVVLKYDNTLITDIFFRGKKVLSDGTISFNEPLFILGGYCGIHIDYDNNGREIQRTYLDDLGDPVITIDGYSYIETLYDINDNPIKVRYYIIKNGEKLPVCHQNGNHGYDSIFDKNGNEIERHFVDTSNNPTKIVSGVYGKRITYDPNTFKLLTISNIDFNGELMEDIDGYVTVSNRYDNNGLPTFSMYLDKNGNPWKSPDGTYGSYDIVDFSQNLIESYNLDQHELYIEDINGVFKNVVKFNDKRQVTEFIKKDKNDVIIETGDNFAIQLWSYDEQNRLKCIKGFNRNRLFISGKRFEYNKEGTHIIRDFYFTENCLGVNDYYEVQGIEYALVGDTNLPALQILINANKQFITSSDGYNAFRIWEDDKERVIKERYYDIDGSPMTSNTGIYGIKTEYIDEYTTKKININVDEAIMEDNNGVAFVVVTKKSSGYFETHYNINGEPYANDGWVYVNLEREDTDCGYKERMFVLNENKEAIEISRPRRADSSWAQIVCTYVETSFDNAGRPLSEYFFDRNGKLVGDADGDSYTTWEYNDMINQEIISLFTVNNDLRIRIKTNRDNQNRIIEHSYIDINNEYMSLPRGYSGEAYEYLDEENKKIVTFFDTNGTVCNNIEGFAHRVYWYDDIGRLVAQQDITADNEVYGLTHFREIIDSEKRENAYYIYNEDCEGNIIPNSDGSIYGYYEDDCNGRTIKHLYLTKDKLPMCDQDGDYGLSYEYRTDIGLTIITCLNEHSNPHDNKAGYGKIFLYTDDQGRELKRMHYTIDGRPVALPELMGSYGRVTEYPNENNKIIGYLDENGDITTNCYGYAYREECFNPNNGVKTVFYYDVNKNNTQSEENENREYGVATIEEDNWRRIISLGKNGKIINNGCGYATKYEYITEDQLCFYKFYDIDDKPVADKFGDYGTEILHTDDGSAIRLVGLNDKYEPHINDYGFCYCDTITDIAGQKFNIYRDLNYNQVLPKLSLWKKIKKYVFNFIKEKEIDESNVFNCRQIGAIFDCVLGKVEGNGYAKNSGLTGTYVILEFDNWKIGDRFDELGDIIQCSEHKTKHVTLLKITLDGSLIKDVGQIMKFTFPEGKIGIRFNDWSINIDTLKIIYDLYEEWTNNKY